MRQQAAGAPEPAKEATVAWTLVDYLFPANRAPVWSGSVNNEPSIVLAKTA
jgi:hypothetical protein